MKHLSATVIIKVHINIRERYTVRIEESFEQQVILDRVDLRDAKTVCHDTSGCRSSSGTYRHSEFAACYIYEVLHNKEVTGKTHGLHYIQLELYTFLKLSGQGRAVTSVGTLVSKFRKIVSLKLYPIKLVISAKLVNLCLSLFRAEHHIAVLILSELIKKLFLCDSRPVLLLRAKLLRYLEEWHDGRMIYGIGLHLVENLHSVAQRFGQVGEYSCHLFLTLEPLLLGVAHSVGFSQVVICRDAYQTVVRLGILRIDEMRVVCSYYLDIMLACKLY